MTSLGDARLQALLGIALPKDPAAAQQALRARTKQLDEQRRRDEREAETLPAVLAAQAAVAHDVTLRTSPELRRLQERGEALRLRLHRARGRADGIVLSIAHWQEAIRSGQGSQRATATASADDGVRVEDLPQLVRMQEMLDEFARVRLGTDRIGRDDTA